MLGILFICNMAVYTLRLYMFKLYGYTFRRSNSSIFIFTSLFNMVQLLKKRICFLRSKFFALKVDPIFKEGEQDVTKFVALSKNGGKS